MGTPRNSSKVLLAVLLQAVIAVAAEPAARTVPTHQVLELFAQRERARSEQLWRRGGGWRAASSCGCAATCSHRSYCRSPPAIRSASNGRTRGPARRAASHCTMGAKCRAARRSTRRRPIGAALNSTAGDSAWWRSGELPPPSGRIDAAPGRRTANPAWSWRSAIHRTLPSAMISARPGRNPRPTATTDGATGGAG